MTDVMTKCDGTDGDGQSWREAPFVPVPGMAMKGRSALACHSPKQTALPPL